MTPEDLPKVAPRPIPPHIPGPVGSPVGCRCFKPRSEVGSSLCIKCKKPRDAKSRPFVGYGSSKGEAFAGKHRKARTQRFEAKQRKKGR